MHRHHDEPHRASDQDDSRHSSISDWDRPRPGSRPRSDQDHHDRSSASRFRHGQSDIEREPFPEAASRYRAGPTQVQDYAPDQRSDGRRDRTGQHRYGDDRFANRAGDQHGYGVADHQGGPVYGYAPDHRGVGPGGYAPRDSEQEFRSSFDVRNQGPGYGERYGAGSGSDSYGNVSSSGHADQRPRESRSGGHRGRGPRGYVRSDERITEDLNERLTDDHELDASEISVSVSDGIATLEGTVDARWMKHRAEDIADRCGGVTDVVNRIRVQRSGSGGYGGSPGGNAETV